MVCGIKVGDNIIVEKDSEINIEIEVNETRVNVARPPDGGWGWVVVFAALVSSALFDGVTYSYGVLTTEFIDHFDVSRTTIGLMGSLLIGMTLCPGPIVGYLCKKYGYRFVMILGGSISSISFMAPFFYAELWFLFLTSSLLTGIGFGMIYLTCVVIVNNYFEKRRGLAVGIAVCGSGLGTFIFGPLIQFLIELYGWRGAMLIAGGILFNLIPCGLLFQKLPTHTLNEASNLNKKKENSIKNTIKLVLKLFSNPIFILYGLSNFFSCVGFNAPFIYVKDRAITAGIPAIKASFLLSSMGIGNFFGRIAFGFIATRELFNGFHLYNASLIICGATLICSWGVTSYASMIVYTLIFGVMAGSYVTMTSIVLVELFGLNDLGLLFGLINICQGVAVFIGPPLAGYIYDSTHSFNAAFLFCGGFLSIAGLMMYIAYFFKGFRKSHCQMK
uniref:Slc16a-16 n=1 Tax=Schmidtea mediterranea TaxID=79327 RepID=A0A0H3YJ05_SCHMD|nr:slc16a-16 [Schmidtea mediterranea]